MSGIQIVLVCAFAITHGAALYSGHLHKAMNKTEAAQRLQKHVAEVERQQPKQMTMPEECAQAVDKLQDPAVQADSHQCEEKGKYFDKAVAALQAADEKAALAHVHEAFQECGKLSDKCAAFVAPRIVQTMRISGVAVSDACKDEFNKAQNSEAALVATADCDKKEKLAEKSLTALGNGDGDGAISATKQGLLKCMNISTTCAFQLAPVIVNSMIMRAMAEDVMTQVLVAQPVLVVDDAEPVVVIEDDGSTDAPAPQTQKKTSSLLQIAASIHPAGKPYRKRSSMVREAAVTTESLVQTSRSQHTIHSLSKFLLELLVNRKSI